MKKHNLVVIFMTFFTLTGGKLFSQFYNLPSKQLSEVELIVTYSLKWVEDTNNLNFQNQEDLILLIGNEISMFMGKNFYEFRTMGKEYEKKGKSEEFSRIPMSRFRTRITYAIYKNYPEDFLTYIDKVMPNILMYEEKLYPFEWKLSSEINQIDNYTCNMATVEYGGRKWTAWYTVDLPYNDGPYKFGGLPGLIMNISDKKGHYVFEFVSVEKPSKPMFIELDERDYIKTSRSNFLKAVENSKMNIINQAKSAGINSSDVQQKLAQKLQNRNNPIEF